MLSTLSTLQQENIVTIRELQKNPSTALKNVTRIMRNGKTFGFFFAQSEMADLMEDLEALASPNYLRSIAKADKNIKEGKTIPLEKLLKEYGEKR
ncbi:MAG: hypothetical protein WCW27_00775 [Patescibacteria group bacterium]|jgi:hypothetical protein